MKHIRYIMILLLGIILFSCASGPGKIDPQSTIEGTIQKAINLLEIKDYTTLFREIAYPKDIEQLTAEMPFEELIKNFEGKPAEFLLKILKIIQKKDPVISNDGLKAEWQIGEDEIKNAPSHGVIFEKFEGKWYLRN
ncbi:MAG: hypothetical protein JXJ04_22860 [Spirochaetales bacterium]|nr:hypothetical protein [Spirochaetales bacterium]